MNKIKILIEGYAYEGSNGSFFASPTSTLIYSNNKKVLIDPGTNSDKLIEALAEEDLKPGDIDIIYLTHYHPDHFLNLSLFPGKDVIDGSMIWRKDEEISFSGKIPGTDLEILPTPGHSPEHSSILAPTADQGLVCVAQDVFWWIDGEQEVDDYEKLINKEDPFASNMDDLKESRKKVLEIADWIIPGHGKMFENGFKRTKVR